MRIVPIVIALALPCAAADLFRDDFSRYPAGWLTEPLGLLNPAIQEYHYLPHRGVPLGPWENAICHMDAWLVGDEDGKPYLEQHLVKNFGMQYTLPLFITGDPEWGDYTIEVKLKPLALDDMAGIVFRYHTNRHYYMFSLSGGNRARLSLRLPIETTFRVPEWKELASAPFPYDTTRYYTLRVDNQGPRIRAYIDGKLVAEASDSEILKGKAGVAAEAPARYQEFSVTAADATVKNIAARVRARESELARLRDGNPRPKLWKKFQTPVFGAGRNARFGDLDGDGTADMLIGQNVNHYRGNDAWTALSCLTAVTLDGKVLWQSGKPNPKNGLLTSDTSFQIHDVDGDGQNEVVAARDFQLQVLDGRTGKIKRWVWMPKAPEAKERAYDLVAGDSISFVNVSGDKHRRDILVKDRYRNFWVYNNKLEVLWKGEGQVGHYPYPMPGPDGRDLIAIGYALWDPAGKLLFSHDKALRDHADGVMIGNLSGDPNAPPRMYASGSDEGFLLIDREGKILKHVRLGHNQSPVVGKFRTDVPGLQYMTVNFWRNPGIVTLFDADGNILEQDEPIHSGAPMLPVNWRGDGQEFVFLSGNVKEGGMIDGKLRRVVMFPDDGHPDLAANVLDLTGDPRDEVVLWNQQEVWIYTQDRPFSGKRIYAPLRSPDYNESNYRTNVSFPSWKEVK
jgi:hypothetical protein